MDWKAMESETIEDLRRLLRFKTANLPGNEDPMAGYHFWLAALANLGEAIDLSMPLPSDRQDT
ncbi:MAG: hypothetical protein JW797_09965 [Bradymonadales bacterium]|nr:hypothetical protein [Bradymonadales bacterium]